MNNLIKFLWSVSLLIFLALLLWVYSYMPEQVALSRDASGQAAAGISRESFFYISLGVFVTSNLILYILMRLVRIIPKENTSLLNDEEIVLLLEGWVQSFSWMLNICYMVLALYFGLLNNPGSFRYAEYSHWLVYMIPVFILLWLLALVVLVLRKGPKTAGRSSE